MEWIITLLVLAGMAGFSYWYVRRFNRSRGGGDVKLMMAAVRRREVGMKRSLELSKEEHDETNALLDRQWRIIHGRWIGIGAHYLQGFASDAAGLPAPGDQDWRLFQLYGLEDYAMFRRCVAVIEEEGNNLLRHHLEIRLIPGESMTEVGGKVKRLL
ncbi:MAG TPA: hypothetical protein PKI90_06630 [bacterium]|nr:hypothetical protein [bacterium]